jgi:photosystem II stability/assembly factor-like uncharacterized protein
VKLDRLFFFRFLLFILIVGLGTLVALKVHETGIAAASTLPMASVEARAVSPSDQRVQYVALEGTGSRVLFKSEDGGRNWERLPLGLPLNAEGHRLEVSAMTVAPYDSSVLYLGTRGGGVYRLSNGGTTVEALGLELRGANVYALAVDRVNPSMLYAWTEHGLYRSIDDGASWHLWKSVTAQALN